MSRLTLVGLILLLSWLPAMGSGSSRPIPRPASQTSPAKPGNTVTWFGSFVGPAGGSVTVRCYNPTAAQPESVLTIKVRGGPVKTRLQFAAVEGMAGLILPAETMQAETDDQGNLLWNTTLAGCPSQKSFRFQVSQFSEGDEPKVILEAEAVRQP